MATYKTPGVYVEEISKFPPSVAQVETAIPAFIGYTEKAEKRNGDSLTDVPTRITSLLEYETYFGRAAEEDSIDVIISDTVTDSGTERSIKVTQPSSPSPYLMYYSMQMYFANGGGPCYINSVGDYSTGIINKDDLLDGLAKIRKEDEPTLLLFPDATNIPDGSESDYWSVITAALSQCNDLQDRFAIIDTFNGTSETQMNADILSLRDGVGTNYLKYGASYYPYLSTILDYNYSDKIVLTHTTSEPNAVSFAKDNLTALETSIGANLTALRDVSGLPDTSFPGTLPAMIDFMNDASGFNLSDPGNEDFTEAKATTFLPMLAAVIEDLSELIENKKLATNDLNSVIASLEDDDAGATGSLTTFRNDFIASFEGTDNIEDVYASLESLYAKLKKDNTDTKRGNTILNGTSSNLNAEAAKLLTYTIPGGDYTLGTDAFSSIETDLSNAMGIVTSADVAATDTNNGKLNGRALGSIEDLDNATYNKIKAEIGALPLTIPPSSAMAGVYARTDANIGVWKAPANTSLNYVIKPSVNVSSEEQADLNVHTTGKSVNAIRTFRGKGTLVWGARTLAGNDNEWRYIPVRRFFNMVEESVSKASEQFVFESNDGNTWVRIKGMIDNFLNQQWKAGALAGSTPEQAYYVRVGLGQTMTAQDILEGRMIIEIGMAAVRPAEFIILRFSHKMQEA